MLKRLKEQEEARLQVDSDDEEERDGSDQAVHDDLDLEAGAESSWRAEVYPEICEP